MSLNKFFENYKQNNIVEYKSEQFNILDYTSKCINCGNCLMHCPIIRQCSAKLYPGPRSIAIGLSREPSNFKALYDVVFYCTGCGACEVYCPSKIPIRKIIEVIRGKLFLQDSKLFPNSHLKVLENLKSSLNIYGQKLDRFGEKKSDAEFILFVGCVGRFFERESVQKTLKLLDYLKLNYTIVDEVCCGSFYDIMGLSIDSQLIEKNVLQFKEAKTNKIVTICPRCFITLKNIPEIANNFKIEHIFSLLDRFNFNKLVDAKIGYHDPCDLGRHEGIYDIPRRIINQISPNFIEFDYSKEYGMCCGAGGGLRGVYLKTSINIAREKINMATSSNMEILLTECPSCLHNLRNAKRSKDNIKIFSVSEFLFSNLNK